MYIAESFEPGALGLGEFACVDLDLFEGLVERHFSFEVIDHFGIADGGAGLGAEWRRFCEQRPDLVKEAFVDHSFDPLVDAAAFDFFRPAEADDGPVGGGRRFPLLLKDADGFAGELVYFEGTNDAFLIVGVDAGGGLGIDLGKSLMKGGEAGLGDFGAKLVADGGIGAGAFEQAVEEGFDVHGRAADGDDGPALGRDDGDCLSSQIQKTVHAEGFGGLDDVDQMPGDLLSFFERGLGRADVHAAINLHGINTYDFAAEGLGQPEGKRALSGCGDSCNQNFSGNFHV